MHIALSRVRYYSTREKRISSFQVKGKVVLLDQNGLNLINNSDKRAPEGSGHKSLKCPNEYLVSSVQRHLQIGVAFSSTRRSTVESRSTIAHSATSHFVWMTNWRPTPLFTLERNRTSAHNATFHATRLPVSKCISRSTLGKDYTNAINVNTKQHNQVTWTPTKGRTLVKSQTDAQYASFPAL